ncbi:MAG TPA: methyltransferase domain-containing protein [Gemmatimonadales bacterium]|nr:methyltransferase domain-containing protein [Gemmatimonadales bacterium]
MIGTELLDDPRADPEQVRVALGELRLLNRIYGGSRAVVRALAPFFRGASGERWTLLDVGTGAGDIPLAARRAARRAGVTLDLLGVERIPSAARAARQAGLTTLLADGSDLPFPTCSVDVVIASQVLHHFPRDRAQRFIAGLARVARKAVVIADLRRSRLAILGYWLAAFPLGLSAVGRHDGIVSLERGFTRAELNDLLVAGGAPPVARYAPLARVVAAWAPA